MGQVLRLISLQPIYQVLGAIGGRGAGVQTTLAANTLEVARMGTSGVACSWGRERKTWRAQSSGRGGFFLTRAQATLFPVEWRRLASTKFHLLNFTSANVKAREVTTEPSQVFL